MTNDEILTAVKELESKAESNHKEILKKFEDQTKTFEDFKDNICVPARMDLRELKVKSGFLGMIGGALTLCIQFLIKFLSK